MQTALVFVILALAVGYVIVRGIRLASRKDTCGCGCSGCKAKKNGNAPACPGAAQRSTSRS